MNSSKRGPVYGFKLSSLEIVISFFFSSFDESIVFLFSYRIHVRMINVKHYFILSLKQLKINFRI